MTTIRLTPTSLRHILTTTTSPASSHTRVHHQRRWARVHDVRFLATHGVHDRVLAKYRDKLEAKARLEGLGGTEALVKLKDAYKERIEGLRRELDIAGEPAVQTLRNSVRPPPPPPPPAPSSHLQQQHQSDNPVSQTASSSPPSPHNPPGLKTLSSFLDIPKTLALPPKEIEAIWRMRHIEDPRSLCAAMPAATYAAIAATARKHPQFVLPLPHAPAQEGNQCASAASTSISSPAPAADIHFLQWTFPTPSTTTVLFTHLAEYKLRGEYASPHTTLTHHLELAESKGLVLVQGGVVEGAGVSVEEAKWLVMCLQRFYGVGAEGTKRRRLLEEFSRGDQGFRLDVLLDEAERVG